MLQQFQLDNPEIYEALMQIVRLCVWLLILAVIFTPLERIFALHPHKVLRKAILVDLFYYFLSSLLPALILSAPISVIIWAAHHFIPSGYFQSVTHLPTLVRVLASIIIGEVGFYWGHRWSHEIPWLWGFHAVHHSAEHMDYLVNTRAHPVDVVFTRLCGLVPLYLLGLASPVRGSSSFIPLLVVLIGTVWGFFIHSNLRWRLGPVEHVVATPAFHHWHHTNDGTHVINKNYAALLPVVDRVFGTLHLPRNEHPKSYGIDQKLSENILGQLKDPFFGKTTDNNPMAENSDFGS